MAVQGEEVAGHILSSPAMIGGEGAIRYGIQSQLSEVPHNDAFMIPILNKTEMVGASGVARYRRELDEAV